MRDEVYGGYAPIDTLAPQEPGNSVVVVAYGLCGLSGFIMGLLATWIF